MKKNGIIFALSLALATLFPLYLSAKGEASETKGQCQALFDRLPDSMKRELQKGWEAWQDALDPGRLQDR